MKQEVEEKAKLLAIEKAARKEREKQAKMDAAEAARALEAEKAAKRKEKMERDKEERAHKAEQDRIERLAKKEAAEAAKLVKAEKARIKKEKQEAEKKAKDEAAAAVKQEKTSDANRNDDTVLSPSSSQKDQEFKPGKSSKKDNKKDKKKEKASKGKAKNVGVPAVQPLASSPDPPSEKTSTSDAAVPTPETSDEATIVEAPSSSVDESSVLEEDSPPPSEQVDSIVLESQQVDEEVSTPQQDVAVPSEQIPTSDEAVIEEGKEADATAIADSLQDCKTLSEKSTNLSDESVEPSEAQNKETAVQTEVKKLSDGDSDPPSERPSDPPDGEQPSAADDSSPESQSEVDVSASDSLPAESLPHIEDESETGLDIDASENDNLQQEGGKDAADPISTSSEQVNPLSDSAIDPEGSLPNEVDPVGVTEAANIPPEDSIDSPLQSENAIATNETAQSSGIPSHDSDDVSEDNTTAEETLVQDASSKVIPIEAISDPVQEDAPNAVQNEPSEELDQSEVVEQSVSNVLFLGVNTNQFMIMYTATMSSLPVMSFCMIVCSSKCTWHCRSVVAQFIILSYLEH